MTLRPLRPLLALALARASSAGAEWSDPPPQDVQPAAGDAASDSVASTMQPRAAGDAGSWHLLPVVLPAYQPETSFLLGGAAVFAQDHPDGSTRRESQLSLRVR